MIGEGLLRALGSAGACDVAAVAAARLQEDLGVSVQVWLVDPGLLTLSRADAPEQARQAVEGSWPGRCFAAQQDLLREHEGCYECAVPLTAHGDRLGVLLLTSPSPLEAARAPAALAARLLADALVSASRHTQRYERLRRERPMTLAAELQWALLPGRSHRDGQTAVAALLEPAYSTSGDAYDWSRDGDVLSVVALEGSGRGVAASLTTTLTLTALRNARVSGSSLSDQAALADQALHAEYAGKRHVSGLLLELDLRAGTLHVVDAGSPQLHRLREGRLDLVELEPQLPLGMFEETVYRPQQVDARPGDRFVVVTVGVYDSAGEGGQTFGQSRLPAVLRDARLLSAEELVRSTIRALEVPDDGLDDDAVVLCLDWFA